MTARPWALLVAVVGAFASAACGHRPVGPKGPPPEYEEPQAPTPTDDAAPSSPAPEDAGAE